MTVNFHKVVGRLPDQLDPDAFYFVRVGAGFDLYITDQTGTVAHRMNPTYVEPEPEPTAPNAPDAPTVTALSSESVRVSFTVPFDGGSPITSTTISLRDVTSDGLWVDTQPALNPNVFTDLIPGNQYEFRVRVANAIGESPWSVAAQVTTPNSGEVLPEGTVLSWTVDEYNGPQLTGNQPTVVDGYLQFATDWNGLTGTLPLNGYYFIIAVKRGPAVEPFEIRALAEDGSRRVRTMLPGSLNDGALYQSNFNPDPEGEEFLAYRQMGGIDTTTWTVIEAWSIGDEIGINQMGGNSLRDTHGQGVASSERIGIELGTQGGTGTCVAALAILNRMPSELEREALRSWANGRVPAAL